MKLFAGSSNRRLAEKIARRLSLSISKMECLRFADGECRVRIEESVKNKTVIVVQSISNPSDNHLMELALMGDALKQSGAGFIIAVIPYLGYSRQDRVHRKGEAVSARVVAKIIQASGFQRLITVDLHSETIIGFYQIPVDNLFGLSVFEKIIKNGDSVIVSPDAGGMKRAQRFAHSLSLPLAFVEKKRDLHKIHTTEVVRVIGNVKNKTAVIVDDIITSGSTLVKAAYMLKQEGATQVFALVTHPDFVSTTKTILKESPIEEIYISDTIEFEEDWLFNGIKIKTSADLLVKALKAVL